MIIEGDLTLSGEHRLQHTYALSLNYTLDTYVILLASYPNKFKK